MKLDVHHVRKTFVKDRPLIRPAVAIGVLQDQNPIGFGAVIVIWAKMRVTLCHEDSTAIINGESGRRNKLWMFGEQLDGQPIIASLWSFGSSQFETKAHQNKKGAYHIHFHGSSSNGDPCKS
jgi:hypothetical protein